MIPAEEYIAKLPEDEQREIKQEAEKLIAEYNEETKRVVRDAREGKGLIHFATIDEMYEAFGID